MTVVIPCFDDGRYVSEAVESARAQEPCELVIVDDGSTEPRTLEVLAELGESGAPIVRQENAGLSAARTAGVAAATTPYVYLLDADDRLAEGALTGLADVLDGHPDASVAWGDVESFGARRCRYHSLARLDPWRITYLCEPQGGSLLARREALLSVGGWDMGSGYEDWDFLMKGAERGWRGIGIPMVTLYYREHEQPRMAVESRVRHAELRALLRSRHPRLHRARRRSRRASPSGWPIKVLWPLIDRMPVVSELTKERLFILARDLWEPWMAPDCAPTVGQRIWRQVRRGLHP